MIHVKRNVFLSDFFFFFNDPSMVRQILEEMRQLRGYDGREHGSGTKP